MATDPLVVMGNGWGPKHIGWDYLCGECNWTGLNRCCPLPHMRSSYEHVQISSTWYGRGLLEDSYFNAKDLLTSYFRP